MKSLRLDEIGKIGIRSAYRARMDESLLIELEPTDLHLAYDDEPLIYHDVVKHTRWRRAINDEYESLINNGTWEMVDQPLRIKVVRNKWMFCNKYKANGTLDKHKVHLCAKDFTQKQGIYYTEVFVPTAKWPTIRILIALVAQQG